MTSNLRQLATTPSLISLFSLVLTIFDPGIGFSQTEGTSEKGEYLSKAQALPGPIGLYQDLQSVPDAIRRSAPFARMLDEMTRKAGVDGTYDFEARYRAFEQSRQDMLRSSIAEKGVVGNNLPLSDAWTNIGLQGTANNGVFSSGCVAAIAIDPINPQTLYAGATSGGVWKSTDGGAHWVVLTDLFLPNLTVASIAIDPKHTNTIYVGTGNGYASIDELSGTGLYKSTDGGGTWNRIGGATLTGTISKVLVDPVHSNILFASRYTSNKGVYRSSDSGVTWSKVYPATGNAAGVVWDIVSGSVVGGIPLLFFVEGNNAGSVSQECGVWESVNEGTSWSKITTTALPRGDSVGRCAIAASTADPKRIFVLMSDRGGDEIQSNRALFRSTDNGVSWNSITIPPTLFRPAASPGAQGWYDCVLGVAPNSGAGHDTIWIGGIEGYTNYNDASGWVQWSGYPQNIADWQSQPHVDQHCVAFDPQDPSNVYIGGDGGIYLSQDAGYNWVYRSNQMVTNRFYHIGLSPTTSDTKTTLGGAQDQGVWKIVNGGAATLVEGGDGMQPIANPLSTSYPYYSEQPNGQIERYHAGVNQWEAIDGSLTDNADWATPFTMSVTPINGVAAYHILYTGREYLWRSTNDGTNWTQLGTGAFADYVSAIGLSQVDSRNIYVGLKTGSIQLTTNSGTTFASKSTGLPSAIVTSIVTNGHDTNFVLASFYTAPGSSAPRVMRSMNKGTKWTDASGATGAALPLVGVNSIALDSANPLRVWYAGTDNGMYYTIDSGGHWSIAGSGIGLAPCRDVQVQKNGVIIRVATFGRGIWEGSTNALPVELSSLSYTKIQTGTVLSWHTDSERGDAGFYVQRSIDGGTFEDISFVPSLASGGTSNVQLKYGFTDTVRHAGTYIYQLKQVDLDGTLHYSNHVEVHWGANQMIVYQNYPNPLLIGSPSTPGSGSGFNLFGDPGLTPLVVPALSTRFSYELPDEDVVSIKIYNSLGKFVAYAHTSTDGGPSVNGLTQEPGTQDAFWDGRAEDGAIAPSGAYFYIIESQKFGSFINKMMLLTN